VRGQDAGSARIDRKYGRDRGRRLAQSSAIQAAQVFILRRALRPAPAYAPADGSYRAVAAPLWRRGVASGIDWVLAFVAFLLLSIPFGILQTLGDAVGGPAGDVLVVLAQSLALGVVVAYFTYFLSTGSTLGMRAMDIHVFAHGSGREPHLARAFARSLLALGFFLATIDAYRLIRGYHGPEGLSDAEELLKNVALAAAGVALAGQLWKLLDPHGRTLWDRLTGIVVVEDVVPTGMPDRLWTPWGT
jgi:uncharacterized RDD family membrane protein YckC